MECLPVDDQARIVRSRDALSKKDWHVQAAIVNEAELGQLDKLVAGSPLASSGSWLPWSTALGGIGWSHSSGSAPGEAATSVMRAYSAMPEPGLLVVQDRASTEAITPADRHTARKV
jgi:hypothetical protein